MRTIIDVDLYDPIHKTTFYGNRSWCEIEIDYIQAGSIKHEAGGDSDEQSPRKYWIHGIRIPSVFFLYAEEPLHRGQPMLIMNKKETLSGTLDTWERETVDEDGEGAKYSFVFVPIDMIGFVDMLNNIVAEKK